MLSAWCGHVVRYLKCLCWRRTRCSFSHPQASNAQTRLLPHNGAGVAVTCPLQPPCCSSCLLEIACSSSASALMCCSFAAAIPWQCRPCCAVLTAQVHVRNRLQLICLQLP